MQFQKITQIAQGYIKIKAYKQYKLVQANN